jgi:anti-anti-sigma factor
MFRVNTSGTKKVFTFYSKLDTVNCANMDVELMQALGDDNDEVEFDMTGVEYVSSIFLRICTMVAKRIGINKLKISNSSPGVKKVFKIAGFDSIINVE